jgi:hypothetical protein
MRLEGLGNLKIFIYFIGPRSCDLPACSIVPQQTTLQCAPRRELNHWDISGFVPIVLMAPDELFQGKLRCLNSREKTREKETNVTCFYSGKCHCFTRLLGL